MRVVQIIYSLDMGGIEEFSMNFASCLSSDGIENHLINLSKGRDLNWCKYKINNIKKTDTNIIDLSDFSKTRKFLSLNTTLARLKPDIVIIHHETNTIRILPAYVIGSFKLIQVQHNTKINSEKLHRFLVKFIVDIYIGVSGDVTKVLDNNLHLSRGKSATIENGIMIKKFSIKKKSGDIVTILSAGRFLAQKNFIALADILVDLHSEANENIRTIIAGCGDDFPTVKEKTESYPGIQLPGAVYDMSPLYEKADIYLSYSIHEGFSLALLEAMASGCAILSTDTSGTRDIVKNGENGILVGINDRHAFLRELKILVGDMCKRKILGEAAARTAENYDFSKTYSKYMALMKGLLSNE